MELSTIIEKLDRKSLELWTPVAVTWRIPPTTPSDPLKAAPEESWATWTSPTKYRTGVSQGPLVKNQKNWFYGELDLPSERFGVKIAGADWLLGIYGWFPFTLWIDGEEMYREDHAWKATGPICDPICLESGRKHRLILCLEPTEIPTGAEPFPVDCRPRQTVEIEWDLHTAAMQLQYAGAIARNDKEKKLVLKAANQIDFAAMEANEWPAVWASVERMEVFLQKALAPLSARAKERVVHIIGHCHIDMDWMWTWPETVHCIRRDFKAITDLMDDFPEVTFTHSQVPTYQVAQEMDPNIFAKIKRRIAEGRWENAAGTWVEGDLNMADGESVARHMLYAADWTKANLNSKARVLWEPDTFGHPGNMPQLARLGELDCYFHSRCNPGRQDTWPSRIWEGVDGTTIPAFTIPYGGTLDPKYIREWLLHSVKHGRKNVLAVLGWGDHGGGIPRMNLQFFERYRNKPLMPTFRFSTMAKVLAETTKEKNLPRNQGETFLTRSLFEGCFTTHASIKRYNRKCESALLTAEALTAMAGIERNAALREAWTKTLFNQFHDIADGASVHDVYIRAHERAEASLQEAAGVAQEAVTVLARPADDGKTLTVINPTGFARTEPVRAVLPEGAAGLADERGKIIPVQKLGEQYVFMAKDVPAFSRRSYKILTKLPRTAKFPAISVVEDVGFYSDFYKIETRSAIARLSKLSGVIGSYVDKAIGRDIVSYGIPRHLSHTRVTRSELAFNVFQVIDESPNPMSAWLINDVVKEQSLLRNATVQLVEAGPVFARFKVQHSFRASKIEEEVIFYQDFGRVDFEATIDWREQGDDEAGIPQLKVSFASAMSAARARFEGPFCITERPANGDEVPTQKWADLTGDEFGFVLLNDSKYGCDALGGRLRMTLLRNPYMPDTETDNGVHKICFAFQPHGSGGEPGATSADLARAGMAFNRPMLAVRTAEPAGRSKPMVRIEAAGASSADLAGPILITALRPAEHSNRLLVRMFETSGKPCKATLSAARAIKAAEEVNFLENPIGKCKLTAGKVAVSFRPFEVKTLLIQC